VEDNNIKGEQFVYTEDQLMARLRFFIGVCLALTLTGIVFVVLYSLIFVTQPLNAISPIDQKFFELIVPIATFLTGTLSGIMLAGGDKEAQKKALDAANKGWDKPPSPPPAPMGMGMGSSNGFGGGLGGNSSWTPAGSSFGNNFQSSSDDMNFRRPMGPNDVPAFSAGVNVGFGGKPAPIQPPHPEI
jgi:hypothetical protein